VLTSPIYEVLTSPISADLREQEVLTSPHLRKDGSGTSYQEGRERYFVSGRKGGRERYFVSGRKQEVQHKKYKGKANKA